MPCYYSTTFLGNYLTSLLERTRKEKNGLKIGFDWVIYNLAITKNWTPVRLPFFRSPPSETPKTKSEAEFGIDLAFLRENGEEIVIFVLKDEALTNRNWNQHSFDTDLRMASTVDLQRMGLDSIEKVSIILAYNKDEDRTGTQLFEQTIQSFGNTRGDGIELAFERWNLTKLTEEVKDNLLKPELMPQHLSSALQYICLQVGDFDFGSVEWENQLVPQWKYFLRKVLEHPIDERKLRLVPVSLMIINEYRKDTPNSYPGWIDLIEWTVLALWNVYCDLQTENLKSIVSDVWIKFYVEELEQYFTEIQDALTAKHGLTGRGNPGGRLGAILDAHIAYWHLGRLGILNYAPQEFMDAQKQNREFLAKHVCRNAKWLVRFLQSNPGALRPLLDIHHVELFLMWQILWQSGCQDEIYNWLGALENRLLTRRMRISGVPFIEARSRMDLVAEFSATSKRPTEFVDGSSYLLLMILELCFSLEGSQRDELLERYFTRIVKGIDENGQSIGTKEITLLGWAPPDDWDKRILHKKVVDGIAIPTANFSSDPSDERSLAKKIRDFVGQCRKKFLSKEVFEVPQAALILACIKHRSPLPPEFWRAIIFDPDEDTELRENLAEEP